VSFWKKKKGWGIKLKKERKTKAKAKKKNQDKVHYPRAHTRSILSNHSINGGSLYAVYDEIAGTRDQVAIW
jgi:hypothetical protein